VRRLPAFGVPPARSDFGKRSQDEASVGQPRVREDRIRRETDLGAEVQNVHVDLAGPVAKARRPPDFPLDVLGHAE
jgi:hypothetical protein